MGISARCESVGLDSGRREDGEEGESNQSVECCELRHLKAV